MSDLPASCAVQIVSYAWNEYDDHKLISKDPLPPKTKTVNFTQLTFFLISSNSVNKFSLADVIGLEDIKFLM